MYCYLKLNISVHRVSLVMKLSLVMIFVFLVVGLVSGFLISSLMNIYTMTIVSVIKETTTLESYTTVERVVTVVKPTTITSSREETVTVTVTRTIIKPTRDINVSCVVFKTSKDFYKVSESVVLVLENGCDYSLRLPNSAPWLVVDANGKIVFSPIALQVITDVKPGEIVQWAWNQRDNEGEQVPLGTYHAKLFTLNAGILITEFKIIEV